MNVESLHYFKIVPMLVNKQAAINDLVDHIEKLDDDRIMHIVRNINTDINNDGRVDAKDFLELFVSVTNMDLSTESSTLELLDTLNPVFEKLQSGVKMLVDDPDSPYTSKKELFKSVIAGLILYSPSVNRFVGMDVSSLVKDVVTSSQLTYADKAKKRKAIVQAISPVILKGLSSFLPQFKGVFSLLSLMSKFKI